MSVKKNKYKFKDLEMVPKRKKADPAAVDAAVKPDNSLKYIQKKYRVIKPAGASDSKPSGPLPIQNWTVEHFQDKNRNSDAPLDDRSKFFDEEGNEKAFRG